MIDNYTWFEIIFKKSLKFDPFKNINIIINLWLKS